MLYQPTNIYPSMTGSLGNGVVDAAKDLTVTWQVNGNSAMVAYQITIYRNNAASTQVYTTGKQTQGCPFYGVDGAGNVQFFSYMIAASALSGAGITNGGEYKLVIRQWWGSSDAQSVTQTSASAFITRNAPGLTIDEISDPMTVREYAFTALYTQAQGDSLNWVRWQFALVDAAGEYETLRDTGKIYGTGELKFTYDGMFTGSRYAVRCSVQTQNGVEADTGWKEFDVQYTTEPIPGTLTACQTRKGSGVRLTFPSVRSLPAEITGDYEMDDSYLVLPTGSKAVWDTQDGNAMALSSDCDIAWRGKADAEGTVLKVTGDGLTAAFTMGKTPLDGSGSGQQWNCAFGAGVYVIAGPQGNIFWSSDLTSWTAATLGIAGNPEVRCVCYGGGKFVAFSERTNGNVYATYSTDGKTWAAPSAVQTSADIWSVCYGNGMYLAAGPKDVLRCTDRVNMLWERVESPNTSGVGGSDGDITIAFDGSKFLVPLHYLYLTTNGLVWSELREVVANHACFGGGIYLAAHGSTLYRSTDLLTWTQTQFKAYASYSFTEIAYGNGIFLSCMDLSDQYTDGYSVIYSRDGEAWGAAQIPKMSGEDNYAWYNACYGDSGFLIVNAFSPVAAVTVQEGTVEFEADVVTTTTPVSQPSFQAMQMNSGAPYNGICFGNGKFVAICDALTFQVSTDGVSWTGKGSFAQMPKRSICYGALGFACIGSNNGAFVMQSADGEKWFQDTQGHLKTDGVAGWSNITYANGDYIAVGVTTDSFGIVARTTDLANWTYATLAATSNVMFSNICAYGDGKYVLHFGGEHCLWTSSDGISWGNSYPTWLSNADISGMRYENGTFVYLTYNSSSTSKIIFSKDGLNVSSSADINTEILYETAYGDGMYVAADQQCFYSSRDRISWNTIYSGTIMGGPSIAFGNGRFVVVGDLTDAGFYADTTQTTRTLKFQLGGSQVVQSNISGSGDMTLLLGDGTIQWDNHDQTYVRSGIAACYPGFENIRSLELDGKQECDYLMVSDGKMSEARRKKLLSDMTYHPVDQDAQFYADFNGSTNGGGVAGTQFTALSIYRLEEGESVLRHIANVLPEDGSVIVDASAVNGRKYTYYAFGVGADTFVTSALISNSVELCLWDWAVLSCTADENGVYHVEEIFLFGKNLVSGGVTNNNTPQILQNFTRYPTVQPAPQNYRSGTLQSLIGTITDCRYSDTRSVRDAIWALSTTANTLFLKNRKGDLLRIRAAGAIEMDTGDNSPLQPQTVSLPWVEIGSAEDAQIVITRRDGAWGG